MKSSIVLWLGLVALAAATAGRLQPAGAAEAGRGIAGSRFHADVRGAIPARHDGRAVFGPVGRAGAPGSSFTITLADDSGALVLTRLDGALPMPGRYPIGESAALDSAGGFRALYIAGGATRPEGVFRGETGSVEIEAATGSDLRGRFALSATGFLADHPDDESRRITLAGAFAGTRRMP